MAGRMGTLFLNSFWDGRPGQVAFEFLLMIYTAQDRQRRLEEMCRLANSRGGVCLSKHFVDNKTKLRWRCAKGHEWRAIPQNVIRNHWCMICGNERQGQLKALTIDMMHKIAAERGGKCLSEVYKNNLTKLRWRCKHGHEWEAVPGSIVGTKNFKGTWCPICVGKLPKDSALQELKNLAVSRGGMLLSKRYQNARSHLRWQCAKGHEWKAVPDNVKHGHWCPVCAGSFPLNIGQMRKAAHDFGGNCLSKKYINVDTHLRWRCSEGHEWDAKPYHVLTGHWCPTCASGISERICRALLERMTGVPFPKTRPSWLKNERGRQMELDGYALSLGLAFEYQGHQHYQRVSFFHLNLENFEQRQQDDECKRRLCLHHGVTLLEIPYYISHDKLQEHLAEKLNELKRELIIDGSPVKIGQLGVWRRKNLAEMKSIAAVRGGKLLSKSYIDASTKLRWRCAEGHIWEAIPNSIKRGGWCRMCGIKKSAVKRAHTMDDMQAFAKAKGGVCLSTNYRNAKSRLRWRCAKGHEWETQASVILGGHWCPQCEKFRLGRKYALTIEDMQKAAAKRGGLCLSKDYLNNREKLLWRCAKGHEWEAVGNSIRSGSWCRICAGKRPLALSAR
jgi:hypothetical protein